MNATCSKCGDCCERIFLPFSLETIRSWRKNPHRGLPSLKNAADEVFVLAHWREVGTEPANPNGRYYKCDQFDSVTRLCLAHDRRPPVCADYPWYKGPVGGTESYPHEGSLPVRCAFWADVPAERRPKEWVLVEIGQPPVFAV